jgi:hypothetical protein
MRRRNFAHEADQLVRAEKRWDLEAVDRLIRRLEALKFEAQETAEWYRQGMVDMQLQAWAIDQQLQKLRRERQWLAEREERDLQLAHLQGPNPKV